MVETLEQISSEAQVTQPVRELRVAMYASPLRSICTPTGVGQHIAQMARELAEHAGVNFSLIATRNDYEQAKPHLAGKLGSATLHALPNQERLLRAALISTNLVAIDRWCGNVDWIYSPKEQPVATRRARLAVTVHDVLPFERGIVGVSKSFSRSTVMRWTLLMRRIMQRADLIATVSEFTRRRLVELLKVRDENRIVVIGNGVGAAYFQGQRSDDGEILERHGLQSEQYFISVGSLTYRKGGDLLLKLAKQFHQRMLPWRLVVTGRRHDAELLAQYNTLRTEIPNIPLALTGYISDLDQAVLLRNAEALVFPSRYEGFGIPVLEAMAAGTPAICMRTSALPEVAGDVAVFVDGDDVSDWLKRIEQFVANAAERAAFVEAGRLRAASFTWDRCASRLVAAMTERS